MEGIQEKVIELVVIYCKNTSAISVSKNPVMHSKTKHIAIKYHFLREQIQEKELRLEYMASKEQATNLFTEPFLKDTFEYLRVGVIPLLELK